MMFCLKRMAFCAFRGGVASSALVCYNRKGRCAVLHILTMTDDTMRKTILPLLLAISMLGMTACAHRPSIPAETAAA